MFTFEVRAIDRAGNTDPTPDVHAFSGEDTVAPQTLIVEHPADPSFSRTGTFSFTATDNMTPAQFMEYECRIDTRDPDLWVECFNPAIFSNLTTGMHTVEVRATDLGEMVDPTPARFRWLVAEPQNCDSANITLTATGDGMINEKDSWENYVFLTDLTVGSEGIGDPLEIPPVPIIGENSRALFRFNLPNDAPNCVLQRAELQLWNESPNEGRSIDATPLINEGHFLESTLTWDNQPNVIDGAEPVTVPVTTDTPRYMKWNVIDHVNAAIDADQDGLGWRISDHFESDPEGDDQTFTSREAPIDPPEMTLPRLMLIYDTDGVPAPPPPIMDPTSSRTRRSSAATSSRWTRSSGRISRTASARASSSARRTSCSTSTATGSTAPTTCSGTSPARKRASRRVSGTPATRTCSSPTRRGSAAGSSTPTRSARAASRSSGTASCSREPPTTSSRTSSCSRTRWRASS